MRGGSKGAMDVPQNIHLSDFWSRMFCSVGSSVGMTGMMAYAISAPSGNCCRNAAGRRLLSSFWRMLAEIAMPHVPIPLVESVGLLEHFGHT